MLVFIASYPVWSPLMGTANHLMRPERPYPLIISLSTDSLDIEHIQTHLIIAALSSNHQSSLKNPQASASAKNIGVSFPYSFTSLSAVAMARTLFWIICLAWLSEKRGFWVTVLSPLCGKMIVPGKSGRSGAARRLLSASWCCPGKPWKLFVSIEVARFFLSTVLRELVFLAESRPPVKKKKQLKPTKKTCLFAWKKVRWWKICGHLQYNVAQMQDIIDLWYIDIVLRYKVSEQP